MADWLLYLAGGFLTISGALIGYFSWAYSYFKDELKDDPSYRAETAKALTRHAWLASYQRWLINALDWLDRWMGRPASLRALGVCVTVAMVYAVVFFVGSWALGGPGTVGNTLLLPKLAWWQQALWGVATIASLVGIGLIAFRHQRIDRAPRERLAARLRAHFGARAERTAAWIYRLAGAIAAASILLAVAFDAGGSGALAAAVLGAFAGVLAVVFAVSGAYAIAFAVVFAIGGALAGAFAEAWAGALAFAAAGAVAVAAPFAGAGAFAVAGTVAAIAMGVFVVLAIAASGSTSLDAGGVALLLFFVALPILNAVLDWPSWWVSRKLGGNLVDQIAKDAGRRRRSVVLVLHGLADFIAAVVLLYLLAIALPFMIELFNLWAEASGVSKPLELRAFLNRAVSQPWPDGLWVLAMLLSTLFPTLLHAMALVASPVMIWLGSDVRRQGIAAELVATNPPSPAAVRYASWHLARTWLIAIIAPLAVVAASVTLIGVVWEPVGDILLGAAVRGIAGASHVAHWLGWVGA